MVFTSKKAIKIDRIYICSVYYQHIGGELKIRRGTYSWSHNLNVDFTAGESQEIPLAYIPAGWSNPGTYGDKSISGYALSKGTAHFVTVRVISGKRTQEKALQILYADGQTISQPTGYI